MARGAIVVLEGVDGVGKTERWARVCEALQGLGVVCTREPATVVGRIASRFLVGRSLFKRVLAWILFSADRLMHKYVVDVGGFTGYRGALSRGYVVLSDRWWVSSFAYQFCGRHYGLFRLLNWFADVPDVIVYVDRDVESENSWARECYARALEEIERRHIVEVVTLGGNLYYDQLAITKIVQSFTGGSVGNNRALCNQSRSEGIHS